MTHFILSDFFIKNKNLTSEDQINTIYNMSLSQFIYAVLCLTKKNGTQSATKHTTFTHTQKSSALITVIEIDLSQIWCATTMVSPINRTRKTCYLLKE